MIKMRMFSPFSKWVFALISSMGFLTGCGENDDQTIEGVNQGPPNTRVNYHLNGIKKLEESYSQGTGPLGAPLRHGISTTWDINGSIIDQRRFEKGKLVEVLFEKGLRVDGE